MIVLWFGRFNCDELQVSASAVVHVPAAEYRTLSRQRSLINSCREWRLLRAHFPRAGLLQATPLRTFGHALVWERDQAASSHPSNHRPRMGPSRLDRKADAAAPSYRIRSLGGWFAPRSCGGALFLRGGRRHRCGGHFNLHRNYHMDTYSPHGWSGLIFNRPVRTLHQAKPAAKNYGRDTAFAR